MKTCFIARMAISLIVMTAATPVLAQTIPDNARVRITYEGYMEGTAKEQDRSRNVQLRGGGFNLNVPGTRTIPIHASYYVEIVYDGNRVSGKGHQKSSIQGLSGSGTFQGTRRGDQCDIVTNLGHRHITTCTQDRFEFTYDYTTPIGQEVKTRVSATQTKRVDLADEERKAAQAKADADKRAAEARAQAARQKAEEEAFLRSRPKATAAQAAVLEAAVLKDSAGWAFNSYDSGSMKNVIVLDKTATVTTLRGNYTYNNGGVGWVQARLTNGKVECLLYWDWPSVCSPIRSPRTVPDNNYDGATKWNENEVGHQRQDCRDAGGSNC